MAHGTATAAFSAQAGVFDAIDAANPLIGWVRGRVRQQALAAMKPGDSVLELNAGTGIDSVYFAEKGMRVCATDGAPGMVEQLRAKQAQLPHVALEVIPCSFLELDELGDRRFQHVFSNFGGLNCTDRLDLVLQGLDRLLLPGGTCTLVIMPHFTPWEMLSALTGNFSLAARRWRTAGVEARVEGVPFQCHYYSPRYVRQHLGPGYSVAAQRTLSFFVPPPYKEGFMERWPVAFKILERIEDSLAHWPLIRDGGDHFMITLHKHR